MKAYFKDTCFYHPPWSLDTPEELASYLKDVLKIVDFAHAKNVKVIIAPESGGRNTAIIFDRFFKKRYPGIQCPKLYFLNVKNVKSHLMLKKYFPNLVQSLKQGQKAMILDTCTHSGKTLSAVQNRIEPFSKKKVLKAIVISDVPSYINKKPDFSGKTQKWGCSVIPIHIRGFDKSKDSSSAYGQLSSPHAESRRHISHTRKIINLWASKVLPIKNRKIK